MGAREACGGRHGRGPTRETRLLTRKMLSMSKEKENDDKPLIIFDPKKAAQQDKIDFVNRMRKAAGLPPLTPEQEKE